MKFVTQDYDETFPMNFYMGTNGPAPCVSVVWVNLVPYIKNVQVYQCPSSPTTLDFPTAMSTIGFPPACPSAPLLKYLSYFPNFALIDWGDPSNVFGPNNGRPVKSMASLDFPADTAVFYDSTGTLPDAYFGLMDEPILVFYAYPAENWLRLGVWLLVGTGVYLLYGRRHSVLAGRPADARDESAPTSNAGTEAEAIPETL